MSKFTLKDLVKEEIEVQAPKTTLWEPLTVEVKEPVKEFSSKTSRIGSLSSLNEDLKKSKTVVKSGWTPLVQKTEQVSVIENVAARPRAGMKSLLEVNADIQPIAVKKEPLDELVQSFTATIQKQEEVIRATEPVIEPVAESESIVETVEVETVKEESLIDKASAYISSHVKNEDSFQQPVAITPANFAEVSRKVRYLEEWLSKVSLAGPGGGAVNLKDLDDISYASVTGAINRQVLTYNASSSAWIASYVPAQGQNTYIQFNTGSFLDADANLRYEANTGTLFTTQVAIPTGTLLSGSSNIAYVIADLTLSNILAYSTGNLLPAGSYGNPNQVPAPWSVYEFTTNPFPILELEDVLSGTGVPKTGSIQYIGTGANSNIVVVSSTYDGLITPIPEYGTTISVARTVLNAGFQVGTQANTDIVLSPGLGGGIVFAGNIVPLADSVFTLGSPTRRINKAYFSSNTIFIYDEYVGVDQSIGAYNGNLVIGGGTGLRVGEFTLNDNRIYINDPARDIIVGTVNATANIIFNRAIQVNTDNGFNSFSVTRSGRVQLNVPSIPAGDPGGLNIVGSSSGVYQPVTNPGGMVHITGNEGSATRLNLDNFNNGNNTTSFNAIIGRGASGTAQTPTKTLNGDILLRIGTVGWKQETGFGGATVTSQSLDLVALEDFYNASRGTAYTFYNAPLGSNTRSFSAKIDSTGLNFVQPAGATYDANIGIRFNDNTKQTTAYIPAAYGSFWDNTTQICNANTATRMIFGSANGRSGVDMANANTQVVFSDPGVYNLQFSAQLASTDNKPDQVSIWFRQNGTDIADSASVVTVPARHAGGDGAAIPAWNYFVTTTTPNEYVEIMWFTLNETKVTLRSDPAANLIVGTSPPIPRIPSTILTVDQIR